MSNNFQQFDVNKNNLLSDSAYTSSAVRKAGVSTGSAASNLHNKLFYQLSTMVAALGETMSGKGYVVSDSSLATLITVLNNIMTVADMTPYISVSTLAGYLAKAPVSIKTKDYTLLTADTYKTIEANSSSALNMTLPGIGTVDNGAFLKIKNAGTGTVTVIGTIDGASNPTLAQYDEITVFSDGVRWLGHKILAGAGTGVTTTIATDPIWAASGDMVVATGPDSAGVLTKGTDGKVLTMVSGAPIWASPGAASLGLDDLTDVVINLAAQGDILVRSASGWINVHHGSTGQVLTSQGAGADPIWAAATGVVVGDFAAVKSENGYQKFPSGVIMQWGKYPATITPIADISIVFPLSFPSTCLNAGGVLIGKYPMSSYNGPILYVKSISTSGVVFTVGSPDYRGQVEGFYWTAVGY